MADFPAQSQDYNRVTITTMSPESVGVETSAIAATVNTAVAWPSANRAIFVPFLVYNTLVAVKLFCSNGSTVSGNIDIGIYDSGGNRLVSAGSTAHAGTSSVQVFDITDTTLQPGVYYLATAMDNTTGTIRAAAPAAGICSAMGVLAQSTAFALPSSATFAAAADAFVPFVGLTARTVV